MNWISTNEKLPKENELVLAVDLNGYMAVAEFINREFCGMAFDLPAHDNNYYRDRITARHGYVTHWMPIPEAPTRTKEEK